MFWKNKDSSIEYYFIENQLSRREKARKRKR